MANEVYIELAVEQDGTKYRVDLAPVGMIEESILKTLDEIILDTDQSDGIDTVTLFTDMKHIPHTFIITGNITYTGDGVANATKKDYLRKLSGMVGNITNTSLIFKYEDDDLRTCFMTRLTITQAGGETDFGYIIELKVGIRTEDE